MLEIKKIRKRLRRNNSNFRKKDFDAVLLVLSLVFRVIESICRFKAFIWVVKNQQFIDKYPRSKYIAEDIIIYLKKQKNRTLIYADSADKTD
ncbi:MAG: hypothetical protein ACOYMD_02910, partial [Paludibacter sp.]